MIRARCLLSTQQLESSRSFKSEAKTFTNGGNYYRGCWDNKIQRKEEKFDMPQSRSPFTSSSTFTGTACLTVLLTYFCLGNVSP